MEDALKPPKSDNLSCKVVDLAAGEAHNLILTGEVELFVPICMCNVTKPIIGSENFPQTTDSDLDFVPIKHFPRRNKVPNEPLKPSVMRMQHIVSVRSCRDIEPLLLP
ncbi:hypothetical protein ACSQ67_008547 [Phaseolus vulgaris]